MILLLAASVWVCARPGDTLPGYFDTNCKSCHTNDSETCNGCHHHGLPQIGLTNANSYEIGSSMTVTMGGAINGGWMRARLYDETNALVATISSAASGTGNDGGPVKQYPYLFTTTAPDNPGTYRYEVAWFGSPFDTANRTPFPHAESRLETNQFTVTGTAAVLVDAAEIEIVPVSPRMRDESTTDVYNIKSSGLNVVGINKPTYLKPVALEDAVSSITGYTWSVQSEPNAGAAIIDLNTPELFKFHPSVGGEYVIKLQPALVSGTANAVTQRIFAAMFVGSGTEGSNTPIPPNCGFSACHGNVAIGRLNKTAAWLATNHAHKLENHLNGNYGAFYSKSCLDCHTLGYDNGLTTGSAHFHQIANQIGFDESIVTTWAKDAASTGGPDHWPDLPAQLQLKSNIQCESCHGPGSSHNGNKANIVGSEYDGASCRQCHDSGSGHQQKFYQWDGSGHSITNLAGEGEVGGRATCSKCHTAEGFVYQIVNGLAAIPTTVTTRNALTCVGCHTMHGPDDNEAQLRKVNAVKILGGSVTFDGGLGNVCANCHNSRVTNVVSTIQTSYRGSHYGPQTEMLMGAGAYDFGRPYPNAGPSLHKTIVQDTCVHCHMAPAPAGANPPHLGGHTWKIIDDETGTSNVVRTCAVSGCHPGLATTDRVIPYDLVDYDGDGFTSGIQTEISGLLENVKQALLRYEYAADDPEHEDRLMITSGRNWAQLPFYFRACLYNYNLVASEGSHGIHNRKYAAAVLQRSYRFATGHSYAQDYPQATIVDNWLEIKPSTWRNYR